MNRGCYHECSHNPNQHETKRGYVDTTDEFMSVIKNCSISTGALFTRPFRTYTVDLLNPQIFGKNDLYIDYCLFLNPFYVFLFVIIFVESHLTSDCF